MTRSADATAQPPSPSASPEKMLAGGGEMGAMIRAFDWSATPLGPISAWPQSLLTAASILLSTRHPMSIWWGPELIQLYNDGFRLILGSHKHPQALGQGGRECWDEVWPIIGSQIERVVTRGEETWNEDLLVPFDRNGFLEEIYFTYSYSPIRDESGGVGGVLVVCAETTQRVVGARRLETLRVLSARTGEEPTVERACDAMAEILAEKSYDLPFSLLYLLDDDPGRAWLAASTGLEPGHEVAPRQIALEEDDAPWPLAAVVASGQRRRIDGLEELELPGGPWPERPTTAVLLPVVQPTGVLVCGVSPRLAFDAAYESFLDLAAAQVGSAIASARAYEEERRRAEALAEIDRAKTAFFSNVSHEFRTPLTLALGPLEEALQSPGRTLAGETLEMVHRNALRLLRLVNTLLDFSRVEAGRTSNRFEPTDLASLTAELASNFRSLMEHGGLAFEIDCPPLPELVYVDREEWERVVLNLLSNAFKYTATGKVSISVAADGGEAVLAVRDTGSGIPEDELPRLFERFHRVSGTRGRSHEGTGIGLALVKDLVERHGGTLDVESELDRGSTFTVRLPFGRSHLPADQVHEQTISSGSGKIARAYVEEAMRWLPEEVVDEPLIVPPSRETTSGARVLVADDNGDMRHYLRRLLSAHWRVEVAADGEAALAAARRERPDLVISDVMMPGVDGFELLAALRADPATAEVPVILLSARAGEESRIEGLDAGADDYVAKPFSARELLARVHAHLMLARARAATAADRAQLHQLFENAPAAIFILRGDDLVFELVNPMYRQLVGDRPLLGKPLKEALPEIEGQGYFEIFERVYESGEPFLGREMPVWWDRDNNGVMVEGFFNFVVQPVTGARGKPDGLAVFAFEVTDSVRARQQTEELAAKVQEEARRKDEFLAMLGHELRNPLAPILNAVRSLRAHEGEIDPERLEWVLDVIARQVGHLRRLVDDLLDMARITRGSIELERRPVTVRQVVDSAVEIAGPLLEERRQRLTVDCARDDLWLDADPVRLTQVVGNLLNNAAKYSPPTSRIRLVCDDDDDRIRIAVEDEGIGIAPDLLPRVFELFTQGERSIDRAHGGLGLGLSLVEKLVALHGGTVVAESEGVGKGSRFVVELPRAEAPDATAPVDEPPAAPPASRRVLVVDDNRDAADALVMLLELSGHQVEVGYDGRQALDIAERFEPEVVLLDIGLPEMDGYAVARQLRARGRDLLLIALTGYGQQDARERSAAAGFDAHLLKPADLLELEALLADRS